MSYLLRRIASLARTLMTPRGVLLLASWSLLVAAVLAERGAAVLAVAGVTLLTGAVMLTSERVAGSEDRLRQQRGEIRSVARDVRQHRAAIASLEDDAESERRVLVAGPSTNEAAGSLLAAPGVEGRPLVVAVVVDQHGDLEETVASVVPAVSDEVEVLLVAPAERIEAAWTAQLSHRAIAVVPCDGTATPEHVVNLTRLRRPHSDIVVLRAGWSLMPGGIEILRAELVNREPFVDGVLSPVRPVELGTLPGAGAATTGHDVIAIAAGRGGKKMVLQRMRTSVTRAPAASISQPGPTLPWSIATPAVDAALELAAVVQASRDGADATARSWPARGEVLGGMLELAGVDSASLTAAERERLIGHVRAVVPGPDRRPRAGHDVDVVVVATSVATLDHLHKWLQPRLGDRSALWLYGDGLDDSQGVAAGIEELGLDGAHVAEWTAAGGRARAAVLSFPYTRLTRAVAEATAAAGVSAVEVPLPSDDVLRVDGVVPLPDILRADERDGLPDSDGRWFSLGSAAGHWLDDERLLSVEEYPHLVPDTAAIAGLRNRHRGETCVVIGNGPSLNDLDLGLLAGTPTFGVNGIFYADDRLRAPLSYYVVEDTMVIKDNLPEIRAYQADTKLFPTLYRDRIGTGPDTHYFTMNQGFYAGSSPSFCIPRFSVDAATRVYAGQSVTIMNLQLAYWMGFSEVVLIGMDFSYTVPDDAEIDGNHITSMGDDPNHFHPDYFGEGKVWKDPKLDRVLANYQLAKLMFEADGRRIVNATPGGKLELFDRVDYRECL